MNDEKGEFSLIDENIQFYIKELGTVKLKNFNIRGSIDIFNNFIIEQN